MSAFDYYKNVWINNYANFEGRARRSEYWYFALFNFLAVIVLLMIDGFIGYPVLTVLYILASFVPGLAVAVRRLHDTGKSGWYMLIGLIPLIGAILLLVFYATDSDQQSNLYGANPKLGLAYEDNLIDHLVE